MAFSRKMELGIGIFGVILDTDVSGLDLTFEVVRSVETAFNTANFTIYNANSETRNEVIKKGQTLRFKAGYEDENNAFGSVFTGTIINSLSYKSGMDWVTEVQSQDIGRVLSNLNTVKISISYAAKTPFSTVINDIAGLLSVPVTGIGNVEETLNAGYSYTGNMSGLLLNIKRALKPKGLIMYIDNSEITIFKSDNRESLFDVLYISPDSGLIGEVAIKDDSDNTAKKKQIAFNTLLNYNIQPGRLITIKSDKVNGNFFIDKVKYVGGMKTPEFMCEVEASE